MIERDTERSPAGREEIMLFTIRENCYVSEPVETKYVKFWLLILLDSDGIEQLSTWEDLENLRRDGFESVLVGNLNVSE